MGDDDNRERLIITLIEDNLFIVLLNRLSPSLSRAPSLTFARSRSSKLTRSDKRGERAHYQHDHHHHHHNQYWQQVSQTNKPCCCSCSGSSVEVVVAFVSKALPKLVIVVVMMLSSQTIKQWLATYFSMNGRSRFALAQV